MTEVSDYPSILAEHGMKAPIEGGRYGSPFQVEGISPYRSSGNRRGQTELHFHQFGKIYGKKHIYSSEDGGFSYIQDLGPGPWELSVEHQWWWATGGDGGELTGFIYVGFFYGLTPPRSDPPLPNN